MKNIKKLQAQYTTAKNTFEMAIKTEDAIAEQVLAENIYLGEEEGTRITTAQNQYYMTKEKFKEFTDKCDKVFINNGFNKNEGEVYSSQFKPALKEAEESLIKGCLGKLPINALKNDINSIIKNVTHRETVLALCMRLSED